MKNKFLIILMIVYSINLSEAISIKLDGVNDEVNINDNSKLDGFKEVTWNMWVNQNNYKKNAGLIGKYSAGNNNKAYLIRTVLNNSISIILSEDGIKTEKHTSSSNLKCGIRKNNEWTMITITYNSSNIVYYRNGIKCDQDKTYFKKINNSSKPLRFGGGNNVFFDGIIDDFKIYNSSIKKEQILRLYNENSRGNNLGQSVTVIVYHRVEKDLNNDRGTVSIKDFNEQMAYLKNAGFNTISMSDYNNWRKNNISIPEKAVIPVFDDGRISVYNNAKPIMDRYNLIGNVMVVTNYANKIIGGSSYMGWSQLKELLNNKWGIESHGVNHTNMLKLDINGFIKELEDSKNIINQNLDEKPISFTFPFHLANQSYTKICGDHYDLCWTWGEEPESPAYSYKTTNSSNYQSLKRTIITNTTDINTFKNIFAIETNIVGEWNMNENFGLTTKDSSVYQNTANLIKGALWSSD